MAPGNTTRMPGPPPEWKRCSQDLLNGLRLAVGLHEAVPRAVIVDENEGARVQQPVGPHPADEKDRKHLERVDDELRLLLQEG